MINIECVYIAFLYLFAWSQPPASSRPVVESKLDSEKLYNFPIRKVWSPYLLCLFACKETPSYCIATSTTYGREQPPRNGKIKRSHSSTRLRHTGGSEELLVGNMGFRLSPRRSRSREIGVPAADLPQTRSGLKKMEMKSLK